MQKLNCQLIIPVNTLKPDKMDSQGTTLFFSVLDRISQEPSTGSILYSLCRNKGFYFCFA